MEVQVLPPSPAVDINYDSTSTTPYATAPSSPQSTIPFTWEEKPGIPKHNNLHNSEQEFAETDTDFAFGYLERHSISAADELFDGGKIKPLKPPPRLHLSNDSPRSPKSPKSPKLRFKEALSPRSKKHEFDPFSEALKQTSGEQTETDENYQPRGRQRTTKNTRCNVSRSLSPLRVSDIVNNRKTSKEQSSPAGLTWYNKWNLKNLLLFRSASEGSATMRKKNQSFSFRSADGGESVKVPAEGLPYRSGLMGCLRFHQNAGSVHEISRGINSVMKR
ncbi:hypothetical protein L1987_31845 [Smallanthus sonchifolius]|uniref:Uncharacterized protein n=1 Tax=Smallanthus sonchifolius TaxID=185202 RepID=A0ACB9I6S1_9ASTR|nr:hypothetical protein L1987_31845 [Smallanthus sonchifolius]